jgi:osmoprotectant transport system substrate-binding protein
MRAVLEPRKVLSAASLAFAIMCCACTSGSGRAPHKDAREAGLHGAVITVGSFDFPESVLLADIYGGALAARGFPVRVQPELGSRELVDPALMDGLIQLVPEYAGSALEFISLGRVPVTSDVAGTNRALSELVTSQRLVVGRPAAAQDANAIVVTAATAARYHLRSVTDLAPVASGLRFGGPPECAGRTYCLPGLRRVYGLRFREFVPLDAGGPLTLQALADGNIDVALLFSTDPSIVARHLVTLADDRGLQPAENVTPLLRRDVVARFGARLVAVLDAVSARLDTSSLRALDAQVELAGQDPRRVAGNWLRSRGLAAGKGAVR